MDKKWDDLSRAVRHQRQRTRVWFVCFAIAFVAMLVLGGMLWTKIRENDELRNQTIEKPWWKRF